ncbi:hypothetical protein RA2_00937 [Roseovarius sp. A-2]|uniref:hypothetical protein n=1 Tax=Roseovarius sp. A-2 TaxID=1570360 RepID=UPI0009B50675|nr:hypothetical protein [Roseovarius sp. A-2]GAW33892.1 hypothetical protein RA2_00937 [Roseovarius sp. A-2]
MLWRRKPAIIVASMGRSGSTLCYAALREAAMGRFGRDPAYFAPSLARARLRRGQIVKTHDYPDALPARRAPCKALFIFGSTYAAALSLHVCRTRDGAVWVAQHFANCKSTASPDDLFARDALGMAQQVKAWTVTEALPVLCLRYEALWDSVPRIARFTGYPLHLPPKTPRATPDLPESLRQRAEAVYRPLDAILDRLPDAFVAGPEMQPHVRDIPDDPAFSPEARACLS